MVVPYFVLLYFTNKKKIVKPTTGANIFHPQNVRGSFLPGYVQTDKQLYLKVWKPLPILGDFASLELLLEVITSFC